MGNSGGALSATGGGAIVDHAAAKRCRNIKNLHWTGDQPGV